MVATWENFFNPSPFYVDANGNPLIGAKLYFYESGTETLLSTYADTTLKIPNLNPMVSNQYGMFSPIYLSGAAYKVILQDANGTQIFVRDPVQGGSGQIVYPIFSTDSSVKYIPSGYATSETDWGKTLITTAPFSVINFNPSNPNGWNVTIKNSSDSISATISLPSETTLDGVEESYYLSGFNNGINPAVDANGNYVIRNTISKSQNSRAIYTGTYTQPSNGNVIIDNLDFPGASAVTNKAKAICATGTPPIPAVQDVEVGTGTTVGIKLTIRVTNPSTSEGYKFYYQIFN